MLLVTWFANSRYNSVLSSGFFNTWRTSCNMGVIPVTKTGRKEGNALFNDALNTFYLRLYGVRHMVKDHSDSERGNPLLPHGLLFWLAARVLLYASSHRQDNTYHCLCYTSWGALAGTRNSSMGPPWRINPTTNRTMSERSYHGATSRSRNEQRYTDNIPSVQYPQCGVHHAKHSWKQFVYV